MPHEEKQFWVSLNFSLQDLLRLDTSVTFSPLFRSSGVTHDPPRLFFVIQSLVQSPEKGYSRLAENQEEKKGSILSM